MTNHKQFIEFLAYIGVTGACQQVVVCCLWDGEEKSKKEIQSETSVIKVNRRTIEYLIQKEIIKSNYSKEKRGLSVKYRINNEVKNTYKEINEKNTN